MNDLQSEDLDDLIALDVGETSPELREWAENLYRSINEADSYEQAIDVIERALGLRAPK